MVLASFNVFFEGDSRRSVTAIVYLKRIEEQENVARKQEHTLADSRGNAGHSYHKLIEECCGSAVGKLVRHGRKELAKGGILRYSLGVAAGVYNEYAKPREVTFAGMLRYVFDNAERRAAAAYALAILIGNNGKMRLARQETCLTALCYLCLEALRLLGVGGSKYYVIPAREILTCKGTFVIVPGVFVGLGEEEGCII